VAEHRHVYLQDSRSGRTQTRVLAR